MSLVVTRGNYPHSHVTDPVPSVDRSFTARRLLKNASSLVAAHPRADYLGADNMTESLARAKGFSADELAILRISIGVKRYTLICVPSSTWNARKFDLLELKSLANAAGRCAVLIPETAIQREPRLSTARAIEEAFGVSVSIETRMAVLVHMIEAGGSTSIMDCACAISHTEPFTAVLHMVGLGIIRLSDETELGPHSRIVLADLSAA